MMWKTIFILLGIATVYIVLGGLVFHLVEEPREHFTKTTTYNAHIDFLGNYSCLSPEALETFVKAVLDAHDEGVVATQATQSQPNWDYASATFFAVTVVTTIGYGNIAPSTHLGQTFCIFYALLGIPLASVLLAGIGAKLRCPVENLQEKIMVSKTRPMVNKAIKMAICLLSGLALVIMLPSLMFTLVEGWNYGASVYYSVITLTTIGFGDYVAGLKDVPQRELYRLVCGLWILLGLAWLAMVIGEAVSGLEGKIAKKELWHHNHHKKASAEETPAEGDLDIAEVAATDKL